MKQISFTAQHLLELNGHFMQNVDPYRMNAKVQQVQVGFIQRQIT